VDPFQGAQRGLGGRRDRRQRRVPGGEGLAGGEPGPASAGGQRGAVPPGHLLGQKRFEHLSGIPVLRLGGGQQLRGGAADIRQPHPLEQPLELGVQRRRRRCAAGGAHGLPPITVEQCGDARGDMRGEPRGLVGAAVAAEEPVEIGAGVCVGVLEPAGELADQPRPLEQFPGGHGDQLVWIIGTVGVEHDQCGLRGDV